MSDRSSSPKYNSSRSSSRGSRRSDSDNESSSSSSSRTSRSSSSSSRSRSSSGSHVSMSRSASHSSRSRSHGRPSQRLRVEYEQSSRYVDSRPTSIFPAPNNGPDSDVSPVYTMAMSPTTVPALSAAPKQMQELDEGFSVRLGVYRPRTALTREQIFDEIDSVKMTSKIEYVFLEAATVDASSPSTNVNDTDFEWARVYFSSAEVAELCAALLNYPGRRSKWRRFVTQRLPIRTVLTYPITPKEAALGQLYLPTTPDTMLVRTADGFTIVSTSDMFDTAGVREWAEQKCTGLVTSRDVCHKFYPDEARNKCTYGTDCLRVHLREAAFLKLLLHSLPVATNAATRSVVKPVAAGQPPRPSPTVPQRCAWELDRGMDTLLLSDLPKHVDAATMHYMFSQCPGYLMFDTVLTSTDKRHGVVVFDSPENAAKAKEQAAAAELRVTFYSEFIRSSEQAEREAAQAQSAQGGASGKAHQKDGANGHSNAAPAAAAADGGEEQLPFPPLPEGWEYGLSRRTMQYFFLQAGKKSTTWKHPVTQERYSAKKQ